MHDRDFFLGQYAPVTTHMAFFEMSAAEFANALFGRTDAITKMWDFPWQVKKQTVSGTLANKLDGLLPLTTVRSSKTLVSATRSGWVAYIPNSYRGGDVHAEPDFLAKTLRVRSLSVVLTEDVPRGQPGSLQFVLRDGRGDDMTTRSITVHKESRWEFSEFGERMPFEEIENYNAKKIKDRLTIEMIERYCGHFGIELFDTSFYSGDGYIIHSYPPPNTTYYPVYPNQRVDGG